MNKVYLILKEDIVHFPPVLSIIKSIQEEGHFEIVFMGTYSDEEGKSALIKQGVKFPQVSGYDVRGNALKKFRQMKAFRRDVESYLKKNYQSGDKVWIMHAETICLLSDLVNKYDTILHFFEYVNPKISWKYRVLNPSFDMGETCRKAYKVVCCEYNRAHITKGLFQLDELPIILPNKYFVSDDEMKDVPIDIRTKVEDVKKKVAGKKVILYQGIFLDKERRLEEFIQAVNSLPEEYVFIAMGKGSDLYESLKRNYFSERILFIDFIKPPYHLLITQLASIGVLSYFPISRNIATVLNPLYCAPNKIFEYGRYGIPMISNDVPGLFYAYLQDHCGLAIPYPIKVEGIKDAIIEIMDNYTYYSEGAKEYYNSVDFVKIVRDILN